VIVLEMMNWNSFKFIWHVLIHIRMDSLSHYRNLISDLLHMLVRIDEHCVSLLPVLSIVKN